MKVSTIALVVGALFCANGVFAASSPTASPSSSPTNSEKAKRLLEGPDAAIDVATDSGKAQELLGGNSKVDKVLGDGAGAAAKTEANKARKRIAAAKLKVAQAELAVAELETAAQGG